MADSRQSARKKSIQRAINDAKSSMFTGMGFFVQFQPYAKSLEESSAELEKTAAKFADILTKYLDIQEPVSITPLPSPDAVPEETIQTTSSRVKKRAFDLAALGAVIPFLLNKESRDYLSSFLTGLTGIDFDVFKNTLITVGAVLTGVFAVKLFKQVLDTITAFQKLSAVTAVLFGLTNDAQTNIDAEKEKIDKDKKEIDKENKKRSKEEKILTEKKKNAQDARDDLKKEKKALKGKGKLSKLFAFATKIAPNVGKKLLTAIPFVGTFAAIGLLLYEIYDEAINFFDESEREPVKLDAVKQQDEEILKEEPESVSKPEVAQPVISSSLEKPSAAGPSAVPSIEKPYAAESVESPSIENAPVQSSDMSSITMQKEYESAPIIEQATMVEPPTVALPSTLNLTESSEQVVLNKKETAAMIVINNINNSSFILEPEESYHNVNSRYQYSTAVGT